MTLTKHLNDLAGTDGLQDQGAANALAGTNGLALVGAIRYNAAWVNYLYGGISALLVYSGAHDTATRQRIERALGRIYGVTVA